MIRSRIAPTPSGYLHIGNAMNFVLTWLMVRKEGGKLRLRIDDIDAPRVRPEYMEDVFRSLEWMGMDWDEGPQSPDEQTRVYSQALRAERYDQMISLLIDMGRVYACECSRKDHRSGTCECKKKYLPLDLPDAALRIVTSAEPILVRDMKHGIMPVSIDFEMRDFVIRRRDGIAAYQVASLADDIDFDINFIVRGDDLLTSTAAQLYLASIIGAENFAKTTFYHHPLIHDDQGQKLSKSEGSPSLRAMRESGMTREDFYIRLSKLMGYAEPLHSLQAMLSARTDY